MHLSIHNCTELRVNSHDRTNANSVNLVIKNKENQELELVMFGLPRTVTDKLILAFADEMTADYADPGFAS